MREAAIGRGTAVAALVALALAASPARACPPRDLPGLVPNGIELGLGTTDVNAAVGDGGLTAALSRCGTVVGLKWPGPSVFDQLTYLADNAPDARSRPHVGALPEMGVFPGLAWEAEGEAGFTWLRDPPWTHRQSYTASTSDVVRTVSTDAELGLRVTAFAFVLPGRDVLVLRYRIEREPDSRVRRARLVLYENLGPTLTRLPDFPVADTGLDHQNDFAVLYDPAEDAVLHFLPGPERDFSILDPILRDPPADAAELRRAVGRLAAGLDGEGVYVAIASRAPIDAYQAGYDDSPLCDHQSAIARRAIAALGLPPELTAVAEATFVCRSTVSNPDGPLGACREARGWKHRAESAYRDALDGELSGAPIAACQANAALARELDLMAGAAEATFYLAAASTRAEAYSSLRAARSERGGPSRQMAETEAWWADLLAPAILPRTDDEAVLRFSRRTLASLRTATDRATGAIVASVATQPPYGLDWPRDGAFLNRALDEAGYVDQVTRHNLFYARVQRRSFEPWSIAYSFQCPEDPAERSYPECVPPGTWEMNYYADPDEAVPGGPFSFEIDETGLGVWTLWDHAGYLVDASARRTYLAAVCPAIERAAATLAACRDPATGLACPASEDDNLELTQGLQSAETALLGLRSAIAASGACGFEAAEVRAWEERAGELEQAMLRSFVVESPVPHLEGGRRAWVIWPLRLLPAADPLMLSHAEAIFREAVAPVLDRSVAVAGYNAENMLARAHLFRELGDEAELAATAERVRFFIRLLTTPGTGHMAEFASRVDRDLDGDGEAPDYLPQNDVPHVWQQSYLYLAAMEAFGPRDGPAPRPCDANGDGAIDAADLLRVRAARGEESTGLLDPRDPDEDGVVTDEDEATCRSRCDRLGCRRARPACARLPRLDAPPAGGRPRRPACRPPGLARLR